MRPDLAERVTPPRDHLALCPVDDDEMPPDEAAARSIADLRREFADSQKEVRALQLEIAELKGALLTEIRHLSHDIKNILQALAGFVPRREIEQAVAALDKRIDEAEKAVKDKADAKMLADMKESHTWLWRSLFGSVSLGIVSWVLWFAKK